MNPFKSRFFAACSILLALSVLSAPVVEARPGGGRSSGFRGSRGFGSGSASPKRYQGNQQQAPQYGSPGQPARPDFGNAPSSGGFMRGMMGGLAGGMIGSMLFGGMGHAAGMGGSGGGIGMLEILLLLGLGYMALRFFANRKLAAQGASREIPNFDRLSNAQPGSFMATARAGGNEHDLAGEITKYDSRFDLNTFKEEQMDAFVSIQAAWNQRDLASVSSLIAPELRKQLDADITQLRNDGRINRIENIAVRNTELIEAWEENGQMFATLRFRANLLDYTVDENTGQLIDGDKSRSVKFEENWSFVRPAGGVYSSDSWKLSAIEA